MNDFAKAREEETEEITNVEQQLNAAKEQLKAQIRHGALWLFVIAGLSLLNAIIIFSGKKDGLLIGLGFTTIIHTIGEHLSSAGGILSLVLDLIIAGVFVLLGFIARNRNYFGFLAGIIIYAVDTLVLIVLSFSSNYLYLLFILFHAFIIVFLMRGLRAQSVFNKIDQKGYFSSMLNK